MLSHVELYLELDGSLRIPADVLQSSGIDPGTKLYCITQLGQITLYNDHEALLSPGTALFDRQIDFEDFIGSIMLNNDKNSDSLSSPAENPQVQDENFELEEGFLNMNKNREIEGSGKTKQKRERGAPRRNVSAYSFFTKFITEDICKENPDSDFISRASIIGKKWKELSQEEREPFYTLASQDKIRYEEEYANYMREQDENQKTRKKKRPVDPNAPKKNVSAFSIFTKIVTPHIIHDYPQTDFKERAVLVSQKWKEMTDEQKKPFYDSAQADKARYENELRIYQELEGNTKKRKPRKAASMSSLTNSSSISDIFNMDTANNQCK